MLDVLNNQLDVIITDGTYFKQRIEQLATPPAAVLEAEAARDALREAARQITEREGNLRAQAAERARAQKERAGLAKRTQEIERRVAARDAGYDAERHNAVRGSSRSRWRPRRSRRGPTAPRRSLAKRRSPRRPSRRGRSTSSSSATR